MARANRDPRSGATEHARRDEWATGDVADGANNCERRQAVLQSTPVLLTGHTHVLEHLWSLVIPFLAAEGTDKFYCEGFSTVHNICCRCRRSDIGGVLWLCDDVVTRRSVFYGCGDCNTFRILNVVSKSMQELCQGPIRCDYCLDFMPVVQHITCEDCLKLREDVREVRVKW